VQFPNGVVVETSGAACRVERAGEVALIHAEGAGRIEVVVRGA
jgi:hypothetical protein